MVKAIAGLLFDDWTLGVLGENLESTGKSVHQHSNEQNGAALEEARGCHGQIVEQGGDDEQHACVGDQGEDGQGWISHEATPATPQAELDLLPVRKHESRLDTLVLGLRSALVITESLGAGTIEGMSGLVSLDLGLEILVLSTSLPASSELVRGTRHTVFETSTDNTLLRRSHGSEEIRN